MAIDTGTVQRTPGLDTNGKKYREDLSDVIYNISPTEVPAQSNFGRGSASEVFKEWIIDKLADAAENAHIDGDNFSGDTLTAGNRLGNYCQISRKDIVVSRRSNVVNKAGRRSEIAYQTAKGAKEIRRDMELDITKRHEAVVPATSTASQSAGVSAWLRTNDLRGAGATSPGLSGTGDLSGYPDAVGTAGTDRALSEATMLNVCRMAYDQGGNPNMAQMNPQLKQGLSTFLLSSGSRVATQYQDQGPVNRGGVSVVGAVDVMVTDFQVMDIVPNRFAPEPGGTDNGEVHVLDTDYWEVSMLDPYQVVTIAKVGDHERRQLIVDYALCSKNEAASGVVADLTDTAAVVA